MSDQVVVFQEQDKHMTDEEARAEAIKLLEYALGEARMGNLWQIAIIGVRNDGDTSVMFSPYADIFSQVGRLEYAKALAIQATLNGSSQEEEKPN